ncbi:Crp/Fnr family transcriptional regulator [Neptuniibacter sp.]|uniref:Crp/Fnr family transcriptional regulator n=1 Tax=Neptuniibacter sp. TaxID=1962643 RepID=UPI002610CABA|nr:Crp/Fnr family transcriptional regulator [Neptuniibacter sp.]MCP4598261.1 Crp/Fnr family transcriptional regulator [Neptuniibacter sp.]
MINQSIDDYLALSEEGSKLLKGSTQVIQVPRHEVPIHKGDKVSGAYMVTKGCLRVFTYTPNGNESTFYLLNSGETCVFSINCLFNKLLYPAWVVAEEDTEVYVIKGQTFKQLFTKEPVVQDMTIAALSSAVFKLMIEVEQLQGWTLSQRLINLLLTQANDENQVKMTQQEIAGRLGTTREVVARILGEMSAAGWIKTGRGKVSVLNTQHMVKSIAE